MKSLKVPRINGLDDLRAEHAIDCVNWPEKFPYAPQVRFGIGHTGREILLRFEVREEAVRAVAATDNGPVWQDSCVEFFISLDGTWYYNFEFNCVGTKLLGYRKIRPEFTHGSPEIMDSIAVRPSLGSEPIALREGDIRWSLEASIPVSAFFRDEIRDLSGLVARANFYKCGDALPTPHFLSWSPIDAPDPDFHLPAFFGEIRFE